MYKIQSQNISKESSRYTQVMINGMSWVNTLKYTPKVTKHQNSRQLGDGWVAPTLSAISRQKVTLIILDGPLIDRPTGSNQESCVHWNYATLSL